MHVHINTLAVLFEHGLPLLGVCYSSRRHLHLQFAQQMYLLYMYMERLLFQCSFTIAFRSSGLKLKQCWNQTMQPYIQCKSHYYWLEVLSCGRRKKPTQKEFDRLWVKQWLFSIAVTGALHVQNICGSITNAAGYFLILCLMLFTRPLCLHLSTGALTKEMQSNRHHVKLEGKPECTVH